MIQNGTHIKSSRWISVENGFTSIWFHFCWGGDLLPRAGETSREITTFGKFNPKSLAPVEIPAWTTITITYKQIGIQCLKWTCHLREWSSDVASVLLLKLRFTFAPPCCVIHSVHCWNLGSVILLCPLCAMGAQKSTMVETLKTCLLTLMEGPQAWKLTVSSRNITCDPTTPFLCSPLMFSYGSKFPNIISKGICIKPLHGEISQHLDAIRLYWT